MSRRYARPAVGAALSFLSFTLFCGTQIEGTTFIVTSTSDTPGPGTFRGAVMLANLQPGLDTILLPAGSINLNREGSGDDIAAQGDLDITDDVVIQGRGVGHTVVYAGGFELAFNPDRVFDVHKGVTASIERMSITGGGGLHFDEDGGGIRNEGDLTLVDVLVSSNTLAEGAGRGAGIFNSGILTLIRSTVSANQADLPGGGIFNEGTTRVESSSVIRNFALTAGGGIANAGEMTLISTTIGQNGVENDGGGIFSDGLLELESCTVADNSTATTSGGHRGGGIASSGITRMRSSVVARNRAGADDDCAGPIESLGHNFIGDSTECGMELLATDHTGDPQLGGLSNLGQPGLAHYPVLQGSPLIDAGDSDFCPPEDQLGETRDDGDGDGSAVCDIGAVERHARCGGEIVLEAGSTGPSFGGTWTPSNAALAHGGKSYWSRASSRSTPSCRFEAAVAPGLYEVFEWHTVWATRTKAAPHLIEFATGRAEIQVDQSIGGGRWNSLGTYAFGRREPGLQTLARVTITARDTVLSTNADAIRIVCKSVELPRAIIDSSPPFTIPEGELVCFRGHGEGERPITDGEWESSLQGGLGSGLGVCTTSLKPGFHTIAFRVSDSLGLFSERVVLQIMVTPTICENDIKLAAGGPGTSASGTWNISAAPNAFGGGSRWSRFKGSGAVPSFTFTADLPPGDYEVQEWHTTWPSRSRNANHMVQHISGSTPVQVDQSILGGRWNSLGIYTFAGRSSVMIFATDTERSTNANGIRFRCIP